MTAQIRPDELIRILRAEFVTKAGGVPGAACVTFVCGATGWRATGGTIARTLVHETAFQLDTGGNARGAYAVDLQHDRVGATEVAGGDYSFVMGLENIIEPACELCFIYGDYNYFWDNGTGFTPYAAHAMGCCNSAENDCTYVYMFGIANDIKRVDFGYLIGSNHEADNAFGVFTAIERNDFLITGDAPTYCASIGTYQIQNGDMWYQFQFGEDNDIYASGATADHISLWCAQFGFEHFQGHVSTNFQFGQSTKSYQPINNGYYDGRMLLSGDSSYDNPSDGTGFPGGFNQDSWFSQSTAITTWPVAWTTSRFEFPIIQDSIWFFDAKIAATERGCANSFAWKIEGVVENDGGNTTILASTVTNVYRDVATKEWQVIADNVNDRLVFQFRDTGGPDATWTNVQFLMHTVEVGAEV